MRYPFLILDHDDTSVDSSAEIHYPAHVEMMRQLRPAEAPISLEKWFLKNFDPGIMNFFKNELHMTDEEIEREYEIWRSYTETRIPDFFPGFLDAIAVYHELGGKTAVVSHSEPDIIRRDYMHSGVPDKYHPLAIHGWGSDPAKRKPNPAPVFELMKEFQVPQESILVVDDLKPGVVMAHAAGVDAAGAGWAHNVPEIQEYMRRTCVRFFSSIAEFAQFIIE